MKTLSFAFFMFLAITAQAQQMGKEYYNWYFGGAAAISFNTPNLEPISLAQSKMRQLEGSASISDKFGNLLFYTDGVNVWDRINNQMPEGRKLGGHESSTQSANILRKPGSKNIFYIFTVGKGPYLETTEQEFNYSIVDLDANFGYGDVTLKNQKLHGKAVTEKLTAVLHSNNEDYWVIAHEMDSPNFIIALLTHNGIEYVKTQSIGPSHDAGSGLVKDGVIGQMKANRKGDRIAAVTNTGKELQLFKFDRQSGELSDFVAVTMDTVAGYYGLEFSASGKYVYTTNAFTRLLQFDISSHHRATIESSRKSIYDIFPTTAQSFGQLQLGPNNKIYLAIHNMKFLGVINKPDLPGNECNFQYSGLLLGTGGSTFGLPNFMVTEYEHRLEITSKDVCIGDSILISARIVPYVDEFRYVWRGPNFFYSESQNVLIPNSRDFNEGYYVLEVFEFQHLRFKDSILVRVHPFPEVEIVGTDTICPPEMGVLKIKKKQADLTYKWSTGDTGEEITVDSPGNYYVICTSKAGCVSEASFTIYAGDNLKVNIVGEKVLCEGDEITLGTDRPSSYDGEYSYLWSTGETTSEIIVSQAGVYTVTVTSQGACTGSDEIAVEFSPIPEVKLSHEGIIDLCVGDEMQIWVIDPDDENRYLWSDGNSDLSRVITETGVYKIYVINDFDCIDSAEVQIVFHDLPEIKINFDNDLIFCRGDSVVVNVGIDDENETILWDDGFGDNSRTIYDSGIYTFKVTNQYGCFDIGEFEVRVVDIIKPQIIPSKFYVCANDTLTLFAVGDYHSYLWSDGSTSPNIIVRGAGIYKLYVQNEIGCTDSAETKIEDISVGISFEQDFYEGEIACSGNKSIIELALNNLTQTETEITEIFIEGSPQFNIITDEIPFKIGAFESKKILVVAYSEIIGIYEAKVSAISEKPCYSETMTAVKQIFNASNIVRLPEITAEAGESICIPIYGKITCGESPIISNATIEIEFDAEYFQPLNLASGTDFRKVIRDGVCRVIIDYSSIRLTDSEQIIDEICGAALIGRAIPAELKFVDADLHDTLISTEKINGSLTLEACVIDLRPIKYYVQSDIQIAPNPASESVEIRVTAEETGLHKLEITDLTGNIIYSLGFENTQNSQNIHIFSLYSKQLKNGFYIIRLKSPGTVVFEKLIIEN